MGSQPGRRRFWIGAAVVVVLAGVGIAVSARGHRLSPEDELSAAADALRRHDPAAARGHAERVLAEAPGDPRALLLAAQAARRSDACADAERFLTAFEQVARPNSTSELEWRLLGVQQGDFGGDEARLRADVDRRDPSAPEILEALGKGYEIAFRFPDALEALDALVALEPGHVPARLVRGRVQARSRQLDGAEDDFRKAVERAPDSADAHLALADLLNRRGHTREAIYHFEISLRARPHDAVARLGLARALADAADLPAAARTLDELLADHPDHPDALTDRGRLALRQKDPAAAERFLAHAVAVNPWHREACRLHAMALKDLGAANAARAEARVAELTAADGVAGRLKLRARDNARDVDARWQLWMWSQQNGEFADGFAWLTEVLRSDPNNGPARTAMANHFDRAGQPRRAAMHRAKGTP